MCIDTDTDTLMRKRSRTRQACPNCAGEQGSIFSNAYETAEEKVENVN